MSLQPAHASLVVIGAGPAGLMAAEVLARAGQAVDVYDAMPAAGRKFLRAGIGGLNLTHAEPFADFVRRYGERVAALRPLLMAFGPEALREWVHALGIATFVGSSGRVFPVQMKAAPLLRAWLQRLRSSGVRLHLRHRFLGWTEAGELRFETPQGTLLRPARAVVLALGGASWPRLGTDGAWVPWLQARGVAVAPLRPANCGFDVAWSTHFRTRFAGAPLKAVVASCRDLQGREWRRQGECVISAHGLEGSLVYALSAPLRDCLQAEGVAELTLDLAPGRREADLAAALARPRGRLSQSNHWRRRAGLDGVKTGLLRERLPAEVLQDPARLAAALKALRLPLRAARPLAEAISTAGGVRLEALDENLMLHALPGVFCAGEMLDWEAPTGGYLLTACFATGRWAGQGVLRWLARTEALP